MYVAVMAIRQKSNIRNRQKPESFSITGVGFFGCFFVLICFVLVGFFFGFGIFFIALSRHKGIGSVVKFPSSVLS